MVKLAFEVIRCPDVVHHIQDDIDHWKPDKNEFSYKKFRGRAAVIIAAEGVDKAKESKHCGIQVIIKIFSVWTKYCK